MGVTIMSSVTTKTLYKVNITSVTINELVKAVEIARSKKCDKVEVTSPYSDISFIIDVEVEPHTMESLGYKGENFSTTIHGKNIIEKSDK